MSNTIFAISRGVLSPEITQEASKEAMYIRENIQYLNFSAELYHYEESTDSPFIRVEINDQTIEAFQTQAPAIALVLEEMASHPTALDGVEVAPRKFQFDLTINYCDVGTEILPHIDTGDKNKVRLSRIGSLCGKGLFGIVAKPEQQLFEPVPVEPGDIHELLNPSNPLERSRHWARAIGKERRISLAYQDTVIS